MTIFQQKIVPRFAITVAILKQLLRNGTIHVNRHFLASIDSSCCRGIVIRFETHFVLYCIVFYLTQRHCFRAILRVQVVMGEGSYSQFYPNTT